MQFALLPLEMGVYAAFMKRSESCLAASLTDEDLLNFVVSSSTCVVNLVQSTFL